MRFYEKDEALFYLTLTLPTVAKLFAGVYHACAVYGSI
jgi:hypothetical protein